MNAAWTIILTALAAGGLATLEWRRPDRRHRAARVGAAVLAVVALALLGWQPAWRRAAPRALAQREAALWTPGASVLNTDAKENFALPGAAAPPDATVLPDVGTLRRRFPGVGALRLYGDGLQSSELAALRGVHVEFRPAPKPLAGPAFLFVRCPRVLTLGEPLTVQGRVSQPAAVTLEAPDGTSVAAQVSGGAFSVTGAPVSAAGRFAWRLRVGNTVEELGVAVVAPDLPRVLALAGAPRFDTAALRRWFEAAGGTFDARTQTGRDKYRYESAHDPPPQFAALDARLLAGYDLVLADGGALAALPPPERDVLRAAVADTGLGLLVLFDDAKFTDAAALFPWKLAPLGDDPERPARVQWPGQARAVETPVPCAPWEIAPQYEQSPLVRDGQGHVLAASAARGRGQIALTLVRETGRWTRANDPAAFAAYWSHLFATLARKTSAADAGRWTLVGGDAGPVFVDQPAELVWSGPAGKETAAASVDGGVRMELARDPAEAGRWRGMFWPRRDGWHRVAGFDFFVAPAGSWSALDAARRRTATARFAEESTGTTATAEAEAERVPVPLAVWLALFLAGAGYLWIERRMTAAG